jgi:hypothetical protein
MSRNPLWPATPAALLHPHLAGGEIQFVVEGHHTLQRNLEERRGGLHGITARIHVGHRLQRQHAPAGHHAFRHLALEALAPGRKAMATRDLVQRHEADVVALAGVLGSRIAQADPQQCVHHESKAGGANSPGPPPFSGTWGLTATGSPPATRLLLLLGVLGRGGSTGGGGPSA